MHHLCTLGGVGFGLDLLDKIIILLPILERIDEVLAYKSIRVSTFVVVSTFVTTVVFSAGTCSHGKYHQENEEQSEKPFHFGAS